MKRQQILSVDDRPASLIALRPVLADVDAEIVEVTSGNDALAATLDGDFALAILDVSMPGMDGYELTSLMRADPVTVRLPIIFVTAAYGEQAQVFKGYEYGAVDYLGKPYDPHVLRSKVRVFLELDRIQAELAEKLIALSVSEEPYRAALGIDKALAEIERGRGTAYDAEVVDACLKVLREDGFAFTA